MSATKILYVFLFPGYLFNAHGEENNSDNLSVLC